MRVEVVYLFLHAVASYAFDNPIGPAQAVPPAVPSGAICRVLEGDTGWPAPDVWRKAIPEVERPKEQSGKKHPQYRLEATTVEEVIAAVKFSKEHNIRLSILNSGHDFHGRNDAPNGLALVTTGLKGARISGSFTPTMEGVPPINSKTKINSLPQQEGQAYVTFGAGYSTQLLNNLLAPSNLFTIGAAHGEVSVAGGWGQTAGHAPLSPRYGLGVDQFVEFKLVTADGKLTVANAVSNPDLFWALRGGGGGTWGVVVEATVKAYQSPAVSASMAFLNTTKFDDDKSIWKVAAQLHADFPDWSSKGVSIFYYLYPNAISVYAMNSGKEGTKAWQDQNWVPYMKRLASKPGMNKGIYITYQHADFKAFFDSVWGSVEKPHMRRRRVVGEPLMDKLDHSIFREFYKRHGPMDGRATTAKGFHPMDSWLLGEKHVKSPLLAQALEDAMPRMKEGQYRGQLIGGGKVLTPGQNDTSVHPAWRRTYAHLVLTGYGGYPDAAPLRKFAPNMGAYVNEASYYTPGWKAAFWGPNYGRLSAIKKRYDPEHLFWVTPGIDADVWTWEGGRLCRTAESKMLVVNATALAPVSDNPNWINPEMEDETKGTAFPFVMGPGGIAIPKSEGIRKGVTGAV